MEKSNGPRTEPWGTPYLRNCTLDVDAFTCTVCFLSVRNDAGRDNPYTARSWFITAKVFSKVQKKSTTIFF